ncbi:hypothetical protein [Desulfovibrio sp. JC010]|uniref:hypothetical protein n=1 Tax=Desulfovibrio sp. JC010 TaxID=2593641 RepID=UPI0013D86155|nr:hypothetical protein [Desulfovibrio sp. JC010]NDV28091.1 hypothetical protein [Desulfovibrio sp. JC010]
MPTKNTSYTNALLFTTYTDVIDRIDTLFMDIRHLQTCVSHTLGIASLNSLLEYEERYLWERQQIKDITDISDEIRKWIPSCPAMTSLDTENSVSDGDEDDASGKWVRSPELERLLKTIAEDLHATWWSYNQSMDRRRHYYTFRSLQLIKRSVLECKLLFNHYAEEAFPYNFGADQQNGTPYECDWPAIIQFLILRRGVMHTLGDIVERVGAIKNNFGRNSERTMNEDPPYLTSWYREHNFFSQFLVDSCKDAYKEIHTFLDITSKYALDAKNKDKLKPGSNIVHHEWAHKNISSFRVINDSNSPTGNSKPTYAVSSSYWTPNRPDLQSIIAHEVSHAVALEVWGGYGEKIDHSADMNVFDEFISYIYGTAKRINPSNPHVTKGFLEIPVDLLALVSKSGAYLFAFFLEYICYGAETLLRDGHTPVKLDKIHRLDIKNNLQFFQLHDWNWFFRLMSLCELSDVFFGEGEENDAKFPLEKQLVAGIRDICQSIRNEVPEEDMSSARKKDELSTFESVDIFWKAFQDDLKIFKVEKKLAEDFKRWRELHYSDYWSCDLESNYTHKDGSGSGWKHGDMELPRHTRGLHGSVRDFLQASFFKEKISHLKKIHTKNKTNINSADEVVFTKYEIDELKDVYGISDVKYRTCRCSNKKVGLDTEVYDKGSSSAESSESVEAGKYCYLCCNPVLFSYLEDIPWTCSVFRALDLVAPNSPLRVDRDSKLSKSVSLIGREAKDDNNNLLLEYRYKVIHKKWALGRTLHQIAVDFHVNQTESKSHHLGIICGALLRNCIDKEELVKDPLYADLRTWLLGAFVGSKQETKYWRSLDSGLRSMDDVKHYVDPNYVAEFMGFDKGGDPAKDSVDSKWKKVLFPSLKEYVDNDVADKCLNELYISCADNFLKMPPNKIFANMINKDEYNPQADNLTDYFNYSQSVNSSFYPKEVLDKIKLYFQYPVDPKKSFIRHFPAVLLCQLFIMSSSECVRRYLDRIILFKLYELYKIFSKVKDVNGNRLQNDFLPIYSILKSKYKDSPADSEYMEMNDFYDNIVEAYGASKDCGCASELQNYVIGRLKIGGKAMHRGQIDSKCFLWNRTPFREAEPKLPMDHCVTTLGRYDCIVSNEGVPLERIKIISSNSDAKRMMAYHPRWELGFKLKGLFDNNHVPTRGNCSQSLDAPKSKAIAFLYVSLNRIGTRLDMLHRLKMVFKEHHDIKLSDSERISDCNVTIARLKEGKQEFIEDCVNLFTKEDEFYLSDGKHDMLIVFNGGADRLDSILQIAKCFYDDILTERAELTIANSDKVLEHFFKDKTCVDGAHVYIRLKPNRLMSVSYDRIFGRIKEIAPDSEIFSIPGREDMAVRIDPAKEGAYDEYCKLVGLKEVPKRAGESELNHLDWIESSNTYLLFDGPVKQV